MILSDVEELFYLELRGKFYSQWDLDNSGFQSGWNRSSNTTDYVRDKSNSSSYKLVMPLSRNPKPN